jgi:hypothetical protein
MKDVLYPIQLDYYKITGNGTVRLSWFSASQQVQIIPKERLFTNSTSYFLSNSNQPLFVEPGSVCSAASECGGLHLTVATAGSTAVFTLQVCLLSQKRFRQHSIFFNIPMKTEPSDLIHRAATSSSIIDVVQILGFCLNIGCLEISWFPGHCRVCFPL